jgi:hypothetical protein
VKLREEVFEKLQSKQLANIIRKLNDGKTLTAREERMLAESRAGTDANDRENFVTTWDELAQRIGRTRRTLTIWREKFKDAPDLPKPRPDGRHDVRAWLQFMANHNLSDEPEQEDKETKAYWDRQRARLEFERGVYAFEVEKQKHIAIEEITAAIGQMLAGFRTALNMLPGSAARWLVGLRDFHQIKNKLQSEVDAVLQALGRCDYLETLTPSVVEKLFSDHDEQFRGDLIRCCDGVFREIGHRALSDLLQRALPQPGTQAATEAESLAVETGAAPQAKADSGQSQKKFRARSRKNK